MSIPCFRHIKSDLFTLNFQYFFLLLLLPIYQNKIRILIALEKWEMKRKIGKRRKMEMKSYIFIISRVEKRFTTSGKL